jgi:galactose mutarotase-like enzyme
LNKILGIGDTRAEVALDKGGMVTQFVYHGNKIIFPERSAGEKSRGGIPICFPFFGASPFEGIPKHGFLRRQTLAVIKEAENVIRLEGQNERLPSFPWIVRYEIDVIVLSDGQLIIQLRAERLNDGEKSDMPINPGFHPYFVSDSRVNYVAKCLARVGETVITEFPKASVKIPLARPLLARSAGRTVEMEIGGGFNADSCVTLWSDNPDQYFCVEPVLRYPDLLRDEERGRFLKQGDKLEMGFRLEVVD